MKQGLLNHWLILFTRFSSAYADCLFIFVKAVSKFRHLPRLGAFGGDMPPQRVHPLRGGFHLGLLKVHLLIEPADQAG
ncbi:hypothetical protein KCX83_12555 [Brucella oryzae]|uniref:hypothetical protein n=1 Tax=Brucella oryzae TaxID=335286 RepID=UPI001B81B843|nr:hypothetical protein [Brucella oryzae]MBR7653152.1 hypothetical protein [Brucella oryzae]